MLVSFVFFEPVIGVVVVLVIVVVVEPVIVVVVVRVVTCNIQTHFSRLCVHPLR